MRYRVLLNKSAFCQWIILERRRANMMIQGVVKNSRFNTTSSDLQLVVLAYLNTNNGHRKDLPLQALMIPLT